MVKMKKVLLLNFKGGVGKTLIADELLFKLEKDKIPTAYVNKDPQRSSIHDPFEDEDAIIKIIDTMGHVTEDFTDMIKEADFVIVPTNMGPADIKPLETMIQMLAKYESKKPILYVFNQWNRFSFAKEFITYFNTAYPHIKTAILAQTESFKNAGKFGMSLEDYQPSNSACKQIDYVYNSMKYELNLKDWRMA